ncbi:MAG: hypothetical protein N2246_01780, partial [Candidatus Sumerlaeia bacterium]|nr:hypothetical protein [Candidatus Sumerlaeia bacterium]
MTIISPNTVIYQFNVLKNLSENVLWEEHLVEHLFLGARQRLRLIKPEIINIPDCLRIIERNLKNWAQLVHPYILFPLFKGTFETSIFYSYRHFNGTPLEDIFATNKLTTVAEFYSFWSRMLEIFHYLQTDNVSLELLRFNDFVMENDSPLLININIFTGIESHLSSPLAGKVAELLAGSGGVYFPRDTFNTKANLINIAQLMYQTIGWGNLQDALRIKHREESSTRKNQQHIYIPLVPDIDPRIENIILKAVADKAEGGYSSLNELIADFQKLLPQGSIAREADKILAPEETQVPQSPGIIAEPASSMKYDVSFKPSPTRIFTIDEPVPPPQMPARKIAFKKAGILLIIGVFIIVLVYAGLIQKGLLISRKNHPPVARASVPVNFIPVNSKIVLDGSASSDPDK